ncbi:MAG: transposase [Opitutaceae bacterium]
MSQTENNAVPATQARGRNGYPAEFRRDSVAAWRSSGLSANKYAAQIGVDSSTLYTWIRETDRPLPGVAGGGAPAAPRTLEALEAELSATRAELERTRLQRDILKKTLGIVCEPSPSATTGSTR